MSGVGNHGDIPAGYSSSWEEFQYWQQQRAFEERQFEESIAFHQRSRAEALKQACYDHAQQLRGVLIHSKIFSFAPM
jgi:hypothetical protein